MGNTKENEFYELMQIAWKNLEKAIDIKREKLKMKKLPLTKVTYEAQAQKNFLSDIKEDTFKENRLSALNSLFKVCKYLDVDFSQIFNPTLMDPNKDTRDIQSIKYKGEYYVYFMCHFIDRDKLIEGKFVIDDYNNCELTFQGNKYIGKMEKNSSCDVITVILKDNSNKESFFINMLHYEESFDEYIGGLVFIQRLTIFPSKEIPLFQMMVISKIKLNTNRKEVFKKFLQIKPTNSIFQRALLKKNDKIVYLYIKKMMYDNNIKIKEFKSSNDEIISKSKEIELSNFEKDSINLLEG